MSLGNFGEGRAGRGDGDRGFPAQGDLSDAMGGQETPPGTADDGGQGGTGLRAACPPFFAGFPNAPVTNSTFIKVHLGNTVTSRYIALPMQ